MAIAVGTIVDLLVRGWHAKALNLAEWVHWGRAAGSFAGRDYRPQMFVLRLLADWKQQTLTFPPSAFDEPVFNALIANWRTPDPQLLAPLIAAACDLHTHQSKFETGSKSYDIWVSHWYDPFEIRALFYLRSLEGLANPHIDHPLMQTPFAVLPEPHPMVSYPLLDAAVARIKLDFPNI